MKLLERNKQTIYYRNFVTSSVITALDEYGNTLETGEINKVYTRIKSVNAYVKSAIGNSSTEPYGDFTDKQRTIYVAPDTDIDEYAELWIGVDPETDADGNPTVSPNFTVSGIARGLNHIRIAVRKVEVKVTVSES